MMRQRGFTLLEMMVVVAILGIVASIALPALSEMVANERVRSASFDLQAAFLHARSEALTRNASITVSPVASDWSAGWNIPDPASSGVFIEQHGSLKNLTVVDSGTGGIVYTYAGRIGNSRRIDISGSDTSLQRCVIVELNGRPRTKSCACAATC